MKFIVIIEDKVEEIKKAIAVVKAKLGVAPDTEGLGIPVEEISAFKMGFEFLAGTETTLVFAHDLNTGEQAISFVKDKKDKGFAGDGVFILTDLMFPLRKGGLEQANGISVVLEAVEAGFPVTICSDTDHHEVRFLPKLCRSLEALHPDAKIKLILDSKNWVKAVDALLAADSTTA